MTIFLRFHTVILGTLLPLLMLFNTATQAADTITAEQQIQATLAKKLPKLKINSVQASILPGLYEVTFGANIVYVDSAARYLLSGDLFDLDARQSITETRSQALRAELLEQLDEKDMIIYAGDNPQHTVTVFTDISCGYCRKLHSEMEDYLAEGIRIRYLAFPRAGVGSDAAKTAESVWCADDPSKAMTVAKSGGEVKEKTCENPIAEQFALGQQLGINGTPALMLANGKILPGYIPPTKLRALLDQPQP